MTDVVLLLLYSIFWVLSLNYTNVKRTSSCKISSTCLLTWRLGSVPSAFRVGLGYRKQVPVNHQNSIVKIPGKKGGKQNWENPSWKWEVIVISLFNKNVISLKSQCPWPNVFTVRKKRTTTRLGKRRQRPARALHRDRSGDRRGWNPRPKGLQKQSGEDNLDKINKYLKIKNRNLKMAV